MELVRLPQATRQLGISYPTLKQWIYKRKIRSVKTAGGHHRIPTTEVDRILFRRGTSQARSENKRAVSLKVTASEATGLEHTISGRNQLLGRITATETIGLLSKITLDIGGQKVTAIITRDACRDLQLRVGVAAAALIKATEVMIVRPAQRRS